MHRQAKPTKMDSITIVRLCSVDSKKSTQHRYLLTYLNVGRTCHGLIGLDEFKASFMMQQHYMHISGTKHSHAYSVLPCHAEKPLW